MRRIRQFFWPLSTVSGKVTPYLPSIWKNFAKNNALKKDGLAFTNQKMAKIANALKEDRLAFRNQKMAKNKIF